MPTISKPKTLNDIEALASNEQAHILVLGTNSQLKKLLLINNDGRIPATLIDNTEILMLKAENDRLKDCIEKLQVQIDELTVKIAENSEAIKASSEAMSEISCNNTASILKLTEEITKIQSNLADTKIESVIEEKPVKKPRKTKKVVKTESETTSE